jgi:hypothetical protein
MAGITMKTMVRQVVPSGRFLSTSWRFSAAQWVGERMSDLAATIVLMPRGAFDDAIQRPYNK